MTRGRVRMWGSVVLLLGCSDPGPEPVDPFVGRWLLETVNGQALPVAGAFIATGFPDTDPVVSGRLTLAVAGEGLSHWDFCEDEGDYLSARSFDEVRYVPGLDDDQIAEVRYIFPLATVTDTIRLSGTGLVMEFNWNQDEEGSDLLRFRRLADGEAEGPVCALAGE